MQQTLVPQQKQRLSLNTYQRQSLHLLSLATEDLCDLIRGVEQQNPMLEVDWSVLEPARHGAQLGEGSLAGEADPLDDLRFQLHTSGCNPAVCHRVEYLFDLLDEHGNLPKSAISDLCDRFHLSQSEAHAALHQLQSLEPAGIGARSLRECLFLQLSRNCPNDKTALAIVKDHMHALAKANYANISAALGVPVDEIKRAVFQIRSLQPYPLHCEVGVPHYVYPELIVFVRDGELAVSPLQQTPALRLISAQRDWTNEVSDWADGYLLEAKQLLDAVNRRQNTLLAIGQQIILKQRDFFLKQAPLSPMTQENLASALSRAVSTISRSISAKYLQFDGAVYPIRSFFSSRIASGGSRDQIQAIIRGIVENEQPSHPVSDGQIARYLASVGQPAAKRTVTKYRQSMHIPARSSRKQQDPILPSRNRATNDA